MPRGFYVTDVGRAKIADAVATGEKVSISKMAIGSGGKIDEDWDYGITQLKQQFYVKAFDSTTDKYMVSPDDPTEIMISAIVPNEVEGKINEIGYLDDENDLIVYGIVREKTKIKGEKGADERIQYENWIKFDVDEVDNIVINVLQGDYRILAERLELFETKLREYVEALEGYAKRGCVVGCGATGGWVKFAETTFAEGNTPRFITFRVYLTTGGGSADTAGILNIGAGFNNSRQFNGGYMTWESAGINIVPENFVLAYPTNEKNKVELWVKVNKNQAWAFEVLSESESRSRQVTYELFNTPTTNGIEEINPEYTQIESTIGSSQNAITVSDTAPKNPKKGMIWFDSKTRTIKYYNGTKWVPFGAVYL